MTKLSKSQKIELTRIAIVLCAFIVVFAIDKALLLAGIVGGKFGWLLPFFLYLAIYVVIAYDVVFNAIRNIFHGQVLDENFLMCLASLGAFALAIYRGVKGEEIEGFDEACAVIIFYQIGEFFQNYAVGKSRKSISLLMDIRPDYANLYRDGEVVTLEPSEIKVGDVILINAGERVPLDGVVINGLSTLDTKALTGESLPRDIGEGDEILSGSVNLTSTLHVRVTKEFYASTVSKILDLVESAADKKSKAENFITKFARFYTPIVVIVALLLIVIGGAVTTDWNVWIYRGLSFLVVSCPCALVISVPLSFFIGLGVSSKFGILIKGSNYLEKMSRANIFVFDKTGTLTKGNFKVESVVKESNRQEILRLASICESGSSHPIAKAILQEYKGEVDTSYTPTNIAGEGIIATNLVGDKILVGNKKFMDRFSIKCDEVDTVGTLVYVAQNDKFKGLIVINDEIKCESVQVIDNLHKQNSTSIMLTGDNIDIANSVAKKVGVDSCHASLLPSDKVEILEQIISRKDKKDVVCFVGDGINDAPSLMRADIGIAMGGVGSDAAIEASDIVIMKDNLSSLPLSKRIAKRTMNIVIANIIFAIVVKVAILVLSALGLTNMWVAVFGDVGVAFLCILNALRLFQFRKQK